MVCRSNDDVLSVGSGCPGRLRLLVSGQLEYVGEKQSEYGSGFFCGTGFGSTDCDHSDHLFSGLDEPMQKCANGKAELG